MHIAKVAINKEDLLKLIGEKERSFLDKVDKLAGMDLSDGKWKKLYALLAEARKLTMTNVFIYESPNLYDYDTSCHKYYPHLFDGYRTALATMIKPEPVKVKAPKAPKIANWYRENMEN